MRGYFAAGVDGVSKPMNLGNLMRIAHAFGASFFFTVEPQAKLADIRNADTSASAGHVPYYQFATAADMRLPQGCQLVGVEITEDAVELPRFKHPLRAAYVFGAERYSLSPSTLSRCAFVVKIPMKFSINVGMAGAIVMYDRLLSLGGYPVRPMRPGGDMTEIPPQHKWGAPIVRDKRR
jgi:tRNA G18 (ribose-2'-O)-methylase SpoU